MKITVQTFFSIFYIYFQLKHDSNLIAKIMQKSTV